LVGAADQREVRALLALPAGTGGGEGSGAGGSNTAGGGRRGGGGSRGGSTDGGSSSEVGSGGSSGHGDTGGSGSSGVGGGADDDAGSSTDGGSSSGSDAGGSSLSGGDRAGRGGAGLRSGDDGSTGDGGGAGSNGGRGSSGSLRGPGSTSTNSGGSGGSGGTSGGGDEGAEVLGRLAGLVRRGSPNVPVVVAVGTAVGSAAEARRTLAEAAQVAAAALREPIEPARGYHRLADLRLRGLLRLLRDDERVTAFAERELGALRTGDERGERLRETLRLLCAHGGNVSAAAAAAHLSRTAFYQRLDQLGRVLGVSLEDPESLLSLYVALLVGETDTPRTG
jgi:hypothetical protein